MTVSKTTTTREMAREFAEQHDFCYWDGDYAAKFADSLTAELQKENARLREALEYGLEGHVIISPHSRKIECNCGICEVSRASLSKEDSRG